MNSAIELSSKLLGSMNQPSMSFAPSSRQWRLPKQTPGPEIVPVSLLEFRAHLLRLTAADRYLRFGLPMSDESICSYARQAEACGGRMLGFVEQGHARGIVELQQTVDRVRCVELAVSVEASWRGRGYGAHLVQCALDDARTMSGDDIVAMINRTNRDMRAIAIKLGATLVDDHDGLKAEWSITQCAGRGA
jgi:GNAT superfamily N-acetyltransferase